MEAIIEIVHSWEALLSAISGLLATIGFLLKAIKELKEFLYKGELKMNKKVFKDLLVIFVFLFSIGIFALRAFTEPIQVLKVPFDVSQYYSPSGWMGDGEGEDGKNYIQINDQWRENCHSSPTCIRITYNPNKKGWAGVYWQHPDRNWGDKPGRSIKGASRIVFWARGEKGGELVQFKAGGIFNPNKKYHDSFEKVFGPIELTQKWKKYEINLKGLDLSSVIGAFAWIANRNGNPQGLTFYLDDIRYQ